MIRFENKTQAAKLWIKVFIILSGYLAVLTIVFAKSFWIGLMFLLVQVQLVTVSRTVQGLLGAIDGQTKGFVKSLNVMGEAVILNSQRIDIIYKALRRPKHKHEDSTLH